MKFTFAWLKDHLETSASPEEIADKLSAIGLDVESFDTPGAELKPFTIARVVEVRRHPNADRLSVCEVDTGHGMVEVVCGAPNARAGLIGVFAPPGSLIPGTKLKLERKAVRGVLSNGMLLSERELNISDNHEGIIELSPELARRVGEPYAEVMGLSDPIFDVKLTPNRPDCTGVRGIARDLSAAGLGTIKPDRKVTGVEGRYECPIDIRLEFPKEARSACACFAGRYIRGVSNGPSQGWMQQRLKAIGLRPINALVDVTNYISVDRGRPLHVYDADKLRGAIRARLGRKGESFLGLDGKTHAVDETMCVIADERSVLGLGGILGGEETGCTAATRNILIECAYFDPVRTAATGRKTGIQSEARYRFERGVDPAFVLPGLDLATAMMLDAAGGEPSRAKVAGAPPDHRTVIAFAFGLVEKLTGLAVGEEEIRGTLTKLGFRLDGKGREVKVTVPSWRPDVHGPADLVEEVVRIAGLDRVPPVPLSRTHGVARPVLTDAQRRIRRARRALASRGLVEAVTWSFIPRETARRFGGGQEALELANPISSEMSSMRPSLLPGLLAAVQRNRNRGFNDLGLFEIGQAYGSDQPEGQFIAASGVRAGASQLIGTGRHWERSAENADLFDAKADVVALLGAVGIDLSEDSVQRGAPPWFHPGRSATVKHRTSGVLGHFGEIHPETLQTLDVQGPVAAFEVFLDALPPKPAGLAKGALRAADLMPVRRDFAFVLDAAVPAGAVVTAAKSADQELIVGVNVFDLFVDKSLGEGKKSLALEVLLQPRERTLTDEEIDAVAGKIVSAVSKATGGTIRR
jgi:phenylalanyl-tRNA synthetase beta chain